MSPNLLSELRSITQRTPSRHDWDELRDLLNAMEEDQRELFDTELAPYLEGALSRWPDELRVAHDLADGMPVMSVSRTLLLSGRGNSANYTQDIIEARDRIWRSPRCSHICRVDIRRVSSNLGLLYVKLLEALPKLRAIFIEDHFENRPNRTLAAKGIPVLTSDFVDLAIDRHGSTLESFGLQETLPGKGSKNTPTSRMWDALFARLDELPNLRALHIRQHHKATKAAADVLGEPRLDGLEELQYVSYSRKLDTSALIEREASKNLRRVRILPISDEDALALINAPNLSGVMCWELHEDNTTDTLEHGWGSERSTYWASRSPHLDVTPRDLIATRWLDLFALDKKALHERLFGASGDLRPSNHTQGIYLRFIRYIDLHVLFEQAHDAMSELRKLAFHSSFTLRPQDVRVLSASPLMERLDALWLVPRWSISANTYGRGTTEELQKKLRAWLAIADDASINPALRLHAWRCATHGDSASDIRSIGRALELEGYSRLDEAALTSRINARAPDVLDDPRVVIIEGDIPDEIDPGGSIAWAREGTIARRRLVKSYHSRYPRRSLP